MTATYALAETSPPVERTADGGAGSRVAAGDPVPPLPHRLWAPVMTPSTKGRSVMKGPTGGEGTGERLAVGGAASRA